MIKTIGLLVILLGLGTSCSKNKSKDFAIAMKSQSTATSTSEAQNAEVEEEKNEEQAEAEEAELAIKQAEEAHRVPEINKIIGDAMSSIKTLAETGIKSDSFEIAEILNETDNKLINLMSDITDRESQNVIIERKTLNDESEALENGLQEHDGAILYVARLSIMDKEVAYYVGYADKESSEATDTDNEETDEEEVEIEMEQGE